MSRNVCCVPGCPGKAEDGVPLHYFPNPDNDRERFKNWVNLVGGDLTDQDIFTIHKTKRICRRHFLNEYLYPKNRLCKLAIPTLFMPSEVVPVPQADTDTTNADMCTNVPSQETIADCEVAQADATVNANIYTNKATEGFISNYEGPNDCSETITETNDIRDVIDEFLVIPPKTTLSFAKTTQRKNYGEMKTVPAERGYKICDNCKKNIVGLCYKCLHCVNYKHCHKCEMQEAHPYHYMIRMPKSSEFGMPENVIDKFKPDIRSVKNNQRHETISCDNELVKDNLNAYDSEVDLPEEIKDLIREEVSRVVKNKLEEKATNSKMKMPHNISKKRKMAILTATINDKGPALVEPKLESENNNKNCELNYNVPDLVSENTNRNCEQIDNNCSLVPKNANENFNDSGRPNKQLKSAIATIEDDASCPGAVHMALSSNVSRLVIEIIKDGQKIVYNYEDS